MLNQNLPRESRESESLRHLSSMEPPVSIWKDSATYDAALVHRYLRPLQKAQTSSGAIPRSLQESVLNDLHWYFTIDLRERAPTVTVNEPMAVVFHERVREIMAYIDRDTIASGDTASISIEVRHALFSYKDPTCHSPVALDAYDHDQRLVRLSYFVHGTPPAETFLIDGQSVKPAYCKYRGCRFFRRMLLRQRIVWLPASEEKTIQVLLGGQPAELCIGEHPFLPAQKPNQNSSTQSLQAVKDLYPPGKGRRQPLPSGLTGIKIRLVRWLARLAPVRKKFEKAWIFLDRFSEADDNAEHLYRWVRQHHPEINAWFLLDRSSTDWNRLANEGFRLMPPGWLRKLLVLNSEHIISSHAEYMYGGFDPRYYADMMQWRYSFLQHGVIKDDLTHWLSNKPFDLFTTTSPAEHASIVEDDTPYTYTDKEMRRTGLPRHDRLLRIVHDTPPENVNTLLVMPTWRGGLTDGRAQGANDQLSAFAASDYARHWRDFLNNERLHELVTRHGKTIVFMPHANSVPFIKAFDPPAHIAVATSPETPIQKLFSRSVALVTDYTSVAFTMAFLRRTVFYYQFDRESFYGGNHNWREGYFNYERDGFGPVSFRQDELIGQIEQFLSNDAETDAGYLARMQNAIPEQDSNSCERVFDGIRNLSRPFVSTLSCRTSYSTNSSL